MQNPFRLFEYNAKVYPSVVAVDDGREATTYTQLYVVIKRVAAKLRKLGVKPGELVMTALPARLDWIITGALFHEACITCSTHAYGAPDPKLNPDWIISDRKLPHFASQRLILIDQAWFDALKDEGIDAGMREYPHEDALCRLVLTSGTTGREKAAAFSVRLLSERMTRLRAGEALLPKAALSMLSLSTVLGFFTAFNSLLGAETCYLANNSKQTVKLLKDKPVTFLAGSPVQFAALLKEIEADGAFRHSVKTLLVGGYSLSAALYKRLKTVFGAGVYCSYGATEVGRVCINPIEQEQRLNTAGLVVYDATIEIVDDAGRVLPQGEDGRVRIKTPTMIREYYKDPEASAESFKDGWFYPGDLGRITKLGLLKLSGRSQEVINRGGVKIDPVAIDHYLLEYPGIRDAAVFGLENTMGIQDVAAAVVAADDFDLQALGEEVRKTFGKTAPTRYFTVDRILRNPAGKVMRRLMSEKIAALVPKEADREPG